jgi:hypothetical protein
LDVQNLSPGTSKITLSEYNYDYYAPGAVTNIYITVTTNGLYALPQVVPTADANGVSEYSWFAQVTGPNNSLSAASFVVNDGTGGFEEGWIDGRQALKQNLIFFLRAALPNYSFQFGIGDGLEIPNAPANANYVYSDLFDYGAQLN